MSHAALRWIDKFVRMREELRLPPRDAIVVGVGLIALLFVRPLFFDLGTAQLENDEALYSHAVHGMVEAGRWLSPWSSPGTGPFFEKPPLKLWLVAGGISWLGLPVNELGMRFWDPVLAAIAFLYVFGIAARLGGAMCGVVSVGALFLFEPLVRSHGIRSNDMESMLLAAYCGGAYHLLTWASLPQLGRRRAGLHILATAAWIAAGFSSKFVAIAFLPALAGGLLLDRAVRERARRDWTAFLLAACLFLAISAPWFVLQYLERGSELWEVIFGVHVMQRFRSSVDPSHLQAWSYYLSLLTREIGRVGLGPWTIVGAVAFVIASIRSRSIAGAFVLAWAVVPITAISVGSSKLAHYLYPFLPPFAIVAGFGISLLAAAAVSLGSSLLSWRGLAASRWRWVATVLPCCGFWILATLAADSNSPDSRPDGFYGSDPLLQPAAASLLGLVVAPALGAELAVVAGVLALAPQPVRAWWNEVGGLDDGPVIWKELAACVESGVGKTFLGDSVQPLVYAHSSRPGPFNHTVYYYIQRAGVFQQLSRPDEALLAFRVWVGRHRSAVAIPDELWQSFLDRRQEGLRERVLALGRRLDLLDDLDESVLATIETGPLPLSATIGDVRILLPGDYAECWSVFQKSTASSN